MPKSQFVDPAFLRAPGTIYFTDIPVNQYNRTIEDEKANYSTEDFIRIFRDISILREFETMLNLIKTQGGYNGIEYTYPGPAHLSLGQEAAAVGQAYILDRDDITFGSHRSHSEILAKALSCIEKLPDEELLKIMKEFLGGKIYNVVEKYAKPDATVKDLAIDFILYGTLAEIFARENGFHMGLGGSMHAFFLPFGIFPNNAIVGGGAPIATGAALFKKCNSKPGIVVANCGDGAVARGPVYEAMTFASMDQFRQLWEEAHRGGMPILYNIFNNDYGMGGQTRGETMGYDFLARVGAGITPSQMHAERVDGFNPLAVIEAMRRKKELLLNGEGPCLLDVVTYRFGGHSPSDSNSYRTSDEIKAWQAVDPIITYRQALVEAGVAEDSVFEGILSNTKELITKICRLASDLEISPRLDLKKDYQAVERLMLSNEKVEKMEDRPVEVLAPMEESPRVKKIQGMVRSVVDKDGKPVPKTKIFGIRDALFEAIIEKYYQDPTLISYGEDVRDWGGAFAVYRGLTEVIPYSRLFNSPIAETAIVGSAVGYGLSGGRVIVELMYADFIGCAGDEIFNQLAKWQAMSAGILKMPVTLRVSVGSKYGAQHSQDWVALCAHIPGLKVVFPATPTEAKGLMTSALNGTDPVVFFESQRIYDKGELFEKNGVPEGHFEWEWGKTHTIQEGKDITILTIGATLYRAIDAAKELKDKYGMEAEIINIPCIVPLDYTDIIASVKKTGKCLLTSDACTRGSVLNDIARNIGELCFDDLDAPVVVVGAENWITPPFEFDADFFPQASWILDAINEKIVPLPGHVSVKNYTPVEQLRKAKAGV